MPVKGRQSSSASSHIVSGGGGRMSGLRLERSMASDGGAGSYGYGGYSGGGLGAGFNAVNGLGAGRGYGYGDFGAGSGISAGGFGGVGYGGAIGYDGGGFGGGSGFVGGVGFGSGGGSSFGSGGSGGGGGFGGGSSFVGGGFGSGGFVVGGFGSGGGFGGGAGGGFFSSSSISGVPFMLNEKQQMQSLNDRLATYLDKVRTLEATNKDLENKLKNFRTSKVVSRDFTLYQEQLQPLRDQISAAIIENSLLALKIGNAQLAADDFRKKYETEYLIRQTVEADILNLKSLKEEYDSHQTSNNQEVEALKKEIEEMTKQHGKSVSILKEEMSGTVSVDVTTTESPDLKQILDDLRAEYEDIVRSNKQELEMWFNKQVETKQAAAIQETDVSESSKIEVTELHHQHQSLQTEMDTLLVSKGALEDNLAAVNGRYQMELHRYTALVGTMEGELVSIRNSITSQSEDYRSLLNIKEKLEKEIAMYRQLLEGVELGAGGASSAVSGSVTQTTVVTKEVKTEVKE